MSKRWLLLIPLVLVVLAIAWFEPTYTVRGWLRGEPFYRGRPASYWEAAISAGDPQFDALGKLKAGEKDEGVPVLIRLLESDRTEVRHGAVDVLGVRGPSMFVAVPFLLNRLDDPDPTVRAAAADALGRIKSDDPRVIPHMLRHLQSQDRYQIIRPLSAFGAAARAAVPDLIEIVNDPRTPSRPRWEAIRTLGKIGPDAKSAVPVLLKHLKEGDDLVREHAAESLGEIGDPQAVVALTQALDDPVTKVRRDAVRSLGRFGPAAKSARPAIDKLMKDKEEIVRDAARLALGKIDDKK